MITNDVTSAINETNHVTIYWLLMFAGWVISASDHVALK